MPRETTLELVVPDGGGPFVGFSSYAKLLELAATTASSEAGFPPEWYADEGTIWVIRRSTIECAAAIAPGTTLAIRTWVADFRRVRSRREYEGTIRGEVVLRGHADWVYVERSSGKPRRISEAMASGFVPEGGAETMPRAGLAIGDPPPEATSLEWPVEPGDLDALDHVNNAKYFDYVERAASALVRPGARPRLHDVEYLDEARAGDRLRAVAWIAAREDETTRIATEIRRAADGAVLTRASSQWAA